jgi:hypothetical protein
MSIWITRLDPPSVTTLMPLMLVPALMSLSLVPISRTKMIVWLSTLVPPSPSLEELAQVVTVFPSVSFTPFMFFYSSNNKPRFRRRPFRQRRQDCQHPLLHNQEFRQRCPHQDCVRRYWIRLRCYIQEHCSL